MSRGNSKRPIKTIDYGKKPYQHDNYAKMRNTISNKMIYDSVIEPHSIKEKPYYDGSDDYAEVQAFHRSNFKQAYRSTEFNFRADPWSYADPCAGRFTVHATLGGQTSAYHSISCGSSHAIGMDGGVPPFTVVGTAGSLKGSISGKTYTAPSCASCDTVTDHLLVSDACGRSSNLIIETRPAQDKVWILDYVTEAPCPHDPYKAFSWCEEVIGDVLIRKYYSFCGNFDAGKTCLETCTVSACPCVTSSGSDDTNAPCAVMAICVSGGYQSCFWILYATEYYNQECV